MDNSKVPQLPKQKRPGEEVFERQTLGEAELKQIIRGIGAKATDQRVDILKALHEGRQHMTAQELYETLRNEGSDIGFATVYRFLRTLTSKGIVTELQMPGVSVRYELTPTDHHHDHITCTRCGKIVEFHNEELEALQVQIADRLGFNLKSHRMELYGECRDPNCLKIEKSSRN